MTKKEIIEQADKAVADLLKAPRIKITIPISIPLPIFSFVLESTHKVVALGQKLGIIKG